jgi:hypothetical protein
MLCVSQKRLHPQEFSFFAHFECKIFFDRKKIVYRQGNGIYIQFGESLRRFSFSPFLSAAETANYQIERFSSPEMHEQGGKQFRESFQLMNV